MTLYKLIIVLTTFCLFSSFANADARLEKQLGLDVAKSKQVQEIQKKYRKEFSAKRGELHREQRKLRRAKSANDSAQIAELEPVIVKLQGELKQIRSNENDEIRAMLTPEQLKQFEEILIKRGESVGSSRDVKEY